QEVWLTPEGVTAGKDDVVEAAIAWITSTTDVEDESEEMLPKDFALFQNYPNPFNPTTAISYQIPQDALVAVSVYNVRGQTIKTLLRKRQPAGYYTVSWDGRDEAERAVASGIYFCRLQAGEFSAVKKMIYLK
ncbi:T9SS type A sorting domain-containing protein, partial [bacterium]|nr:T9SS type A sorting domain-containing protein [bacterium]